MGCQYERHGMRGGIYDVRRRIHICSNDKERYTCVGM